MLRPPSQNQNAELSKVVFEFKTSSVEETEKLGWEFGRVARLMMEHFTQDSEMKNQDPQTKHIVIGLKSVLFGSGKTKFGAAAMRSLYDETYVPNAMLITSDKRMCWQNITSESAQIQHRHYDSNITGPYFQGDPAFRVRPPPPMPERKFRGIDFVEHTGMVPPDMMPCLISVRPESPQSRLISIELPDFIADSECVRKEFMPAVQELQL